MPIVTEIPTQEQYQKIVTDLDKRYQEAKKQYAKRHDELMTHARIRYLTTETKYGNPMCKGGGDKCWEFIHRDAKQWNEVENKQLSAAYDAIEKELIKYQEDVARLQTEKKQADLNAELARQQKIIEDNIRETFRIETEKMQAASKALTKERQAKIIPPPPPVIQTPKNEPLAILSDMDRLENYVNTTPQTTIQESKINYSALAIIGAIGIVSILLVRRFA
jgi:multidrug efflux pump subunit AcrA (membrane-fusion protein)